MIRLFRKSRKYPIQKDEKGRSLRKRAFELFDLGYRPADIYHQDLIPIKKSTLYRYFEQWKRNYDHLSLQSMKQYQRNHPEFTDQLVNLLSEYLEIPVEEVYKKLMQPWGLKQLMFSERSDDKIIKTQNKIENRLKAALQLISLIEKIYFYTPEKVNDLVTHLLTLKVDEKLVIMRSQGDLTIRIEVL